MDSLLVTQTYLAVILYLMSMANEEMKHLMFLVQAEYQPLVWPCNYFDVSGSQ